MSIRITIIIATFNSAKILPKVLDSIQKQTFPKEQLEVILMDGGSTDDTFEIAKKYRCRVIPNPKTEPVYAKFLGYIKAKGQYLVYLDHDEVIENPESLQIKYDIFHKNPKIKAVIGSGYKNPTGYPFINNYINEFGDPFSFFIYRLSKDARFFVPMMKKRYPVIKENSNSVVFDFAKATSLPIIELCAAGSMIDANYFKKEFPETLTRTDLIPHFFYLLLSRSTRIAVTKNDALMHYSSDTFGKYLNKIRWRVKNNIHHTAQMGAAGYTGRSKYQSSSDQFKKFLFLPYCYTLIFLIYDSTALSISRKDLRYFLHMPLSIFTANLIVYHYILKLRGYTPQLKSYDESKVIK